MNILTKLTKRNLMLNKKRAIGTIIGIMLSTALICAVAGMFTSFRETLIQYSISERGYFHIALETISRSDLKKYELNKDIKEINIMYELGLSKYENADTDNPYIVIYSTERDSYNKLSNKLLEGKFPSNSNELLISKKMAVYSNLKVGDYVEFDVGKRKSADGYELTESNPYSDENQEFIENPVHKKYKVVGITNRQRNNTGVYGITTGEENDNIHAYIALKNPRDFKKSFVELLGADSYEDIADNGYENPKFSHFINNELLRWEVFSFSDSTIKAISTIATVVISIIIVVSVFCIRNSFAISTTEKMKMYGMLASIGATKKQIKKSVLLECLFLGLVGIPLGILCGVVAVYILIQIVNALLGNFLFNGLEGIVFKISLLPIFISIILGMVTIYFSGMSSAKKASRVSPIDNLRSSKEIKIKSKKLRTPKIISKIFKTGGVLAYKNLKRSKKKYRTTVISLTVSVLVFISMFSFIDEGLKQTSMYYKDYEYNVVVYNGGIAEYDDLKIKTMRNIDNINKSYVLYGSRGIAKVVDKDKINIYKDNINDNNQTADVSINIVALDSDSLKKYARKIGVNYNEIKKKGILIDEFNYYSKEDNIVKIVNKYKYKKGDVIHLNYEMTNKTDKLDVELMAVTTKRPFGLEGNYYDGGYLLLDKEQYEKLEFCPSMLMIDSNKPYDVVKDIELLDSEINITNFDEQAKAERALVIVVSIFLYGFIAVITLIGVTNIFNTLTSNMELRQKEFATLKSIGMTKKEFDRMINLETLFYSSKSLVYGTIFGIAGSYLIHCGFNENLEIRYHLPVTAIVISIVFVFIIVYIIMRYSISKINKQNTIETIRKENV